MKVKVFYPNKNDKIEFTRKELEELLDEVYNDGYADGKKAYSWTYTPHVTWTSQSDGTFKWNDKPAYTISGTLVNNEKSGCCSTAHTEPEWKY